MSRFASERAHHEIGKDIAITAGCQSGIAEIDELLPRNHTIWKASITKRARYQRIDNAIQRHKEHAEENR